MKVYRFLYSLGLGLLAVTMTHSQQVRDRRGRNVYQPIKGREQKIAEDKYWQEVEKRERELNFDIRWQTALLIPTKWAKDFIIIYAQPSLHVSDYSDKKREHDQAAIAQTLEALQSVLLEREPSSDKSKVSFKLKPSFDKSEIDAIFANLKSKGLSTNLTRAFNYLIVRPINEMIENDRYLAEAAEGARIAREEAEKAEAAADEATEAAKAESETAEAERLAEEAEAKGAAAAKEPASSSSSLLGSIGSGAKTVLEGAKTLFTTPIAAIARQTEDLKTATDIVNKARNAARAGNNSYNAKDEAASEIVNVYRNYESLEKALNEYLLASENKVVDNDHRLLAVAKLKNSLLIRPRKEEKDTLLEPLLSHLWQDLYGAAASVPATARDRRNGIVSSLNNMLPQLNITSAPATQPVKDKYIALLTNEKVVEASQLPKAKLFASQEDKMNSKRGDIARIVQIIANAYNDNKESRANAYKQDLWAAGRETINQARRGAGVQENWDQEKLKDQFGSPVEEEAALDAIIDFYLLNPRTITYEPAQWSITEITNTGKDANLLQNAATTVLGAGKNAASAASSAASSVSGLFGSSSTSAKPAGESAAVIHVTPERETAVVEPTKGSSLSDYVSDWNFD